MIGNDKIKKRIRYLWQYLNKGTGDEVKIKHQGFVRAHLEMSSGGAADFRTRHLESVINLEVLVVVRAIVPDVGSADVGSVEQEWGDPRRVEG